MRNTIAIAAVAAALSLATPSLIMAQGTAQTITTVDIKTLATGFRSSKIVGSPVINENHDTIGKIDDLLISRDHHLYAVLSVGGFLGIGSKLVAVQYGQLVPTPDNSGFVLAGATKESLKALPEYRYTE
jgi:PRC-barrel domain protein